MPSCRNPCNGLQKLNVWCHDDPCNIGKSSVPSTSSAFICACEANVGAIAGLSLGLIIGAAVAISIITIICYLRRRKMEQPLLGDGTTYYYTENGATTTTFPTTANGVVVSTYPSASTMPQYPSQPATTQQGLPAFPPQQPSYPPVGEGRPYYNLQDNTNNGYQYYHGGVAPSASVGAAPMPVAQYPYPTAEGQYYYQPSHTQQQPQPAQQKGVF